MWAATCTVSLSDTVGGTSVSLTTGTTTGNDVQCKFFGPAPAFTPALTIMIPAGSNSATSGDVLSAGTYSVIVTASVQGQNYNTAASGGATSVTVVSSDVSVTIANII